MPLTDWISLALVCILGALSPGPSLAVIYAVTRMNGRASGLTAAFGHGLGILLYAFAAATSLSYLINNHADLFFILQLIGALMLLWLGYKLLKSSFSTLQPAETPDSKSGKVSKGLLGGFTTGFIIAAFNPKTAAFFVSLFSQFLNQEQSLATHIGMAGLAGFIDVSAYVIYVFAFTTATFGKAIDKIQHILERLLGLILIFLGISLLASYVF